MRSLEKHLLVWLLVLLNASYLCGQNTKINYANLNECQQKKFETYHQGSYPIGLSTWNVLDDTQQLEYAGGTQALGKVGLTSFLCDGLGEFSGVKSILGSRPGQHSADQFHIEGNWLLNADNAFEALPGWRWHIAWLHPGQYGYQQNEEGNPFLGIVVLFDENDPKAGQFHIDFRSWFSHYFPDNGNIAKNYSRYCSWYGQINGYAAKCPSGIARFDWSNTPATLSSPSSDLRDTVLKFLDSWYIQQNIDGLMGYVAKDNAVDSFANAGLLPLGAVTSRWLNLFYSAFDDGPGSVHFDNLANAIGFTEPAYPKSAPHFSYLNQQPERDRFAIISALTPAAAALFPASGKTSQYLDPSARFLNHLKETYGAGDVSVRRLSIVVYQTIGLGLVKEACILYWINEGGTWKLAAFQGTD